MDAKPDSEANEMMEMEEQLLDEMREEYRQRLQQRLQERIKVKERSLAAAQGLKKNALSRCISKASSGTSASKRSRGIAPR
jgi:hypothetical protein